MAFLLCAPCIRPQRSIPRGCSFLCIEFGLHLGTPKHSIQGLHPSVPGPATLCVCTPPGPPPHVASGGGLCTSPEISPLWSIIELGGHHWVTPPRLYVTSAGLTKSQQLANLQNLFQKVRYQTCHFLDFSTIVTFQYKQYKLTIKMIFYC